MSLLKRENIFGFLFLLDQDNDFFKLGVRLVKKMGGSKGDLNPSVELNYWHALKL